MYATMVWPLLKYKRGAWTLSTGGHRAGLHYGDLTPNIQQNLMGLH